MQASAILSVVALAVFGAVKARFTGLNPMRGAWQTTVLGGLAAGAAYGISRLISGVAGI
jgi:vacuolar iron transporter family protein